MISAFVDDVDTYRAQEDMQIAKLNKVHHMDNDYTASCEQAVRLQQRHRVSGTTCTRVFYCHFPWDLQKRGVSHVVAKKRSKEGKKSSSSKRTAKQSTATSKRRRVPADHPGLVSSYQAPFPPWSHYYIYPGCQGGARAPSKVQSTTIAEEIAACFSQNASMYLSVPKVLWIC